PFKVAEFDIMYNEGISTTGDLIDLGVENDIIAKRGSFFSYGDLRLGQGRENAKTFLFENPQVAQEINRRVRDNYGLPVNFEPAAPLLGAGVGVAVETPGKSSRAAAPAVSADDNDLELDLDGEIPTLFSEAA
ncbi:MAG: hypothetical protein IT329_19675, partial [Caldilineaceae bacterium]|nr:hypothetical protein [Caldilineaceae bacterium]